MGREALLFFFSSSLQILGLLQGVDHYSLEVFLGERNVRDLLVEQNLRIGRPLFFLYERFLPFIFVLRISDLALFFLFF